MATLYDTGNIVLDDIGASIAEDSWSEASANVMDSVTLNDKAAKIVKIIISFTDCAAVDGSLYIFSRDTSGTWETGVIPTYDPVNTTGQMIKITCDALYEIDDTTYYFANNDTTTATKLWIAYYNDSADTCVCTVRILYETMALSS